MNNLAELAAMERLIAIGVALYLTYQASLPIAALTSDFVHSYMENGGFVAIILTASVTVLFFMGSLKLGEIIIVKDKSR